MCQKNGKDCRLQIPTIPMGHYFFVVFGFIWVGPRFLLDLVIEKSKEDFSRFQHFLYSYFFEQPTMDRMGGFLIFIFLIALCAVKYFGIL